MCGIAGYVSLRPLAARDVIGAMCNTLAHRGPDASGVWFDPDTGLAIGHRRLAIIDLSPSGEQPMTSASGRYVIAFNGEVYNFEELRDVLEHEGGAGRKPWRGTSDTEVVLEAIDTWGLESALQEFVGMFVFALWDRRDRTLHLVRDRIGEKPIYYGSIGESFVFGSELKALAAFPDSRLEIDRGALLAFLQFGYVPTPLSIYRGIYKLYPGSFVAVSVLPGGSFRIGEPKHYWSLDSQDAKNRSRCLTERDDAILVDELHARLLKSVRRQMVADVPIGAFLSGGIDSTAIVSLMQAQSSRPIRTFTIGFHEDGYNEAQYAKQIARHLGTDHTELYLKASEAAAVIPRLPQFYDEPFADSSGVPTYLVSQLARQHVTVSLSGDGGDELFGGYPRYQFCSELWRLIDRVPRWGRWVAAEALTSISPRAWDGALGLTIPSRFRSRINGHRLHRLARLLQSDSFDELYVSLVSQWRPHDGVVIGGGDGQIGLWRESARSSEPILNRMRRFDIKHYLPDDILTKVDRASMSVSLESRAPFLDHEVVEFAWMLPERVLVREGQGKWILRQVIDRYVPRELTDRPKAGFGIPVAQWLRGELREWAEDLLNERVLRAQGFFAPGPVRRMWQEHLSGAYDRQAYVWDVLMFQAWLEAQQPMVSGSVGSCTAQPA